MIWRTFSNTRMTRVAERALGMMRFADRVALFRTQKCRVPRQFFSLLSHHATPSR